ncbi:MAG: SDR family NAD(P)-dependent oxidoreductase [Dehalococcoidia bacterium]
MLTWLRRRRPSESFEGRVVVITGGSRGLGLLLAREYAGLGCRVAICARDPDALDRARRDLEARGAEVLAVRCDVGDRQQVEAFVAEVSGRFGAIDILVNNAGVIQVGPMEDLPLESYEQAMATMYWGVVYPTLAVLPSMRARGEGRILNVTSIGGKVSVPHLSPYSSAKFAAVGFSEGLHAELAGSGISVTTVVPGLMRTGSHLNALFGGRAPQEATWFALGATLPLLTVSGEHAARAIVAASVRRQPVAVIGVPPRLIMWLHGVFPGLTSRLMGLVNRYLFPAPSGRGVPTLRTGRDALAESRFPLLDRLTALGGRAAERTNQHPRPGPALRTVPPPAPPPPPRG